MTNSGKADPSAEKQSQHSGHRNRVRERFVRNGFDGMMDYEVLEALLIYLLPRKDVKPLAKALLKKFTTVSETLEQPLEVLMQVSGMGRNSAIGLKMFGNIGQYCLREKCHIQGDLLNRPELIYDYVRMKMGLKRHESYMVIFLDTNHRLIEHRIIAEGTVNYIFTYIRNIMEMAIEVGACGMILVHNHPSGVCLPTPQDIASTIEICKAFKSIEVDLYDHLIISHDEYFSFVAHGIEFSSQKKGKTYG